MYSKRQKNSNAQKQAEHNKSEAGTNQCLILEVDDYVIVYCVPAILHCTILSAKIFLFFNNITHTHTHIYLRYVAISVDF